MKSLKQQRRKMYLKKKMPCGSFFAVSVVLFVVKIDLGGIFFVF